VVTFGTVTCGGRGKEKKEGEKREAGATDKEMQKEGKRTTTQITRKKNGSISSLGGSHEGDWKSNRA